MCDEITQKEAEEFLQRRGLSRREFTKAGAALTMAAMLPAVANAVEVELFLEGKLRPLSARLGILRRVADRLQQQHHDVDREETERHHQRVKRKRTQGFRPGIGIGVFLQCPRPGAIRQLLRSQTVRVQTVIFRCTAHEQRHRV